MLNFVSIASVELFPHSPFQLSRPAWKRTSGADRPSTLLLLASGVEQREFDRMDASADSKPRKLYEFGPFRLDPDKELLLREDENVLIAPKAFQVLLVLIRNNKQVVTKDDLMKTVWPDTFVEEANLSRNIFLLRKALGGGPADKYIVTVPGRGYRFAEDVQLVPDRELNIVAASHSNVEVLMEETRPWGWIAAVAVLLVVVAAGAWKLLVHRAPVLTPKDTVVLADFTNSTGDTVFDGTLRQGLAVQLHNRPT